MAPAGFSACLPLISEVLGRSGLMAQPVLAVRMPLGLGVEQGRSGWGVLPQPGSLLESDLRAEPRMCEELRETQKTGRRGRGWAWAQPGHWLRVPSLTLVVRTLPSLPSLPRASWGLIVLSAHLASWQPGRSSGPSPVRWGRHRASLRGLGGLSGWARSHPEGPQLGGSVCVSHRLQAQELGCILASGKPQGVMFWGEVGHKP